MEPEDQIIFSLLKMEILLKRLFMDKIKDIITGILLSVVIIGIILLSAPILLEDYQGYAKCPSCHAAYKLQYGLPGQHNLSKCRNCGSGPLVRCSKEESGWDDNREPDI